MRGLRGELGEGRVIGVDMGGSYLTVGAFNPFAAGQETTRRRFKGERVTV